MITRLQALAEMRSFKLSLTPDDEGELLDLMFDVFQKEKTARWDMGRVKNFDALNEMSLEGMGLTFGMKLLFENDYETNKRDLNNYYMDI